jgi:hypothetical protein
MMDGAGVILGIRIEMVGKTPVKICFQLIVRTMRGSFRLLSHRRAVVVDSKIGQVGSGSPSCHCITFLMAYED